MATTDARAPVELDLGYAWAFTTQRRLACRPGSLTAAGVPAERIRTEKKSGARVDREGLTSLAPYTRPGVTVVVHAPDRLDRKLREVLNLLHDLADRQVGVRSLADPLPVSATDEGMARIAASLDGMTGVPG